MRLLKFFLIAGLTVVSATWSNAFGEPVSFSTAATGAIRSQLTVDPRCAECAAPTVPWGNQNYLFLTETAAVESSATTNFFPILNEELLKEIGLTESKIQSPLGQLLLDNFNLWSVGKSSDSFQKFGEILDSISEKENPLEFRLASLGRALSAFDDDEQSWALRQLRGLAHDKKVVAMQRMAHYALARSYEKISDWENAMFWYARVVKIAPATNRFAQSAIERKRILLQRKR